MTVSDRERGQFERDGWFVREGVLPPATVNALCERLSEQVEHVARDYQSGERREWGFWPLLARSAHALEVFFDTSRGSPMAEPPAAWERYVARVGHGLHLHDDRFGAAARHRDIGGVIASLRPPPARFVQSAVVYKQPRNETVQFGWHQDAWYLTVEPESLMLAFVALDDMDAANGALQVASGSHRDGLYERVRLGADGWEPLQRPRRFEPERPVLLPLRRGDVAFVDGRCFHASDPNRSERPRRSFIVHAIGGQSRMAPGCWVSEPPGGFMPVVDEVGGA